MYCFQAKHVENARPVMKSLSLCKLVNLVTPIPVAAESGVTPRRTMSACAWHNPGNHFWLEHEESSSFIPLARHLRAGIQALEDAKEPWLKIRKRELIFFPSSFFTRVTYKQAHELGPEFLLFFAISILSWHYLFLFLFFSWQIFFAKVFYYTRSALFLLRCWTVSKQKCLVHFKNTFIHTTMMSL